MTDNSSQAAGPSTYKADDINPKDLTPKQVHRLPYKNMTALHAAIQQKVGPEKLKVVESKETAYLKTHSNTPEAQTRLLVEGNRELQQAQGSASKVKTSTPPDKKPISRFSSPST